ncbi:MAG TPA: YfhO family protein [Vicinamibacteria bacterium]
MSPPPGPSRPRPHRADVLAALALLSLVGWLFRDVVFRGRVFYERDIFFQWWGQAESFVRVVAAGSWPVWSPWGSFGQPMWANMNNQVLYPLTWLNLLLFPWKYYVVYAVVHVLLGSAGTFVLARRLGFGRAGALVSAAVFMSSGPLLSFVNVWNHLGGAAWLPWSLAAGEAALTSGTRRHVLLWGATLGAAVFVGSPDLLVFAVLLSALLVLRRLRGRGLGPPSARAAMGRFALAVLVAFGLSTAQWLPAADLLRHSARQQWAAYDRDFWSIHPVLLAETVLPAFVDTLPLAARYRAELFESREPYLHSHYLGLAALALVAAAVAGRPRPLRRTLVAAGVLAALFALGRHTPFYELSLALAPPLGVLRFPSKALIVVALAWALLAGMGYEQWRDGLARRRWLAVGGVLLIAVAAGAAILVGTGPRAVELGARVLAPLPPGTSPPDAFAPVRAAVAAAVVMGGIVLVLVVLSSADAAPGRRRLAAGLVAALAVADTALAHRAINPTAPPQLYTGRPQLLEAGPDVRLVRGYVYDYVQFPLKTRQHLGTDGLTLAALPAGTPPALAGALALRDYGQPSLMAAFGIETSFDFDLLGLHPPERVRLERFLRDVEGTPTHLRLLRMAGVGWVEALHTRGFEDLIPVTSFPTLFPQPARLYRVPEPLPRFFAVDGVRADDGADGLRTVAEPGFDPTRELIVPDRPARAPRPGFTGAVRLQERRPDRVRLEATLSEDGYVVLLDGHDSGWRAAVDGRPAPVLRADIAFRAVPVPAGRHVVEFVYRPRSITLGLAGSALWVLLCVWVWASDRPAGVRG